MTPKTQYLLDREAKWKEQGFILFDEAKPEVGRKVEAIRVLQPRGFGGVILRTEYKVVPLTRESEYGYTDTLNGDQALAPSAFEAWRELETYTEDGSLRAHDPKQVG